MKARQDGEAAASERCVKADWVKTHHTPGAPNQEVAGAFQTPDGRVLPHALSGCVSDTIRHTVAMET